MRNAEVTIVSLFIVHRSQFSVSQLADFFSSKLERILRFDRPIAHVIPVLAAGRTE